MSMILVLNTSSGSSFAVTHVRLYPNTLVMNAETAARDLRGGGKDLWFFGSPLHLIAAKALTDRLFSESDQKALESAKRLRAEARQAAQWFEIVDTHTDATEGLRSIVAYGKSTFTTTMPKEVLVKHLFKPSLEQRTVEVADAFVLYPGDEFMQIRASDSEHSLRLSAVESFRFDRRS